MSDVEVTGARVAPGDLESPLVDLSGLSLETIANLPDSALGIALRRIHEAAEGADDLFNTDYKQEAA
ncbi:hypothetical protein [Streptomyces odontomachi]|uniref:hypothetical protein n=1 Tax=Streptomyces odontomachi TaxID=2944940 RepID=UPI00210EA284|nr:hypothetical protein [Streptomyces sp. ODS25]